MADVAIKAEGLGKRYRIGALREPYHTLRDAIVRAVKAPGRLLSRLGRGGERDTIWALKDVSFEVGRGEVVGVIGRNGAGKSTLLKILSRITKPTEGRAEIRGRVGSLLEVGTGFHPELTGRENIFLNGSILGMRRREIRSKFDEIVAFAEIEKFIDTPVKRYSSGMSVRLAFAVAAHLDPEILLVDEVLAVGDAAFQKKCLGKMGDVAREGRTVLFVSHNMIALQSLCSRAIWLNDGKLTKDSEASQVISQYLQSTASSQTEQSWDNMETAPGNATIRLHKVRVRPKGGSPSEAITMQTPFQIEVEFWNLVSDAHLHITLHLYTEQQVVAFSTGSLSDPTWHGRPYPTGLFRSMCQIPGDLLNSGTHRVVLLVVQDGNRVIYRHEDALSFDVLDLGKRGGSWYGKEPGVVRPQMKWTTEYIDDVQMGA